MSNRFSLGVRTTATAAGACWEIRTSANIRARVVELGIFMAAATASTFGLGRPAAIGVTPTTPVDLLPNDFADVTVAAQVQSALAWGTAPTNPTGPNYLRRISLSATIGVGVIWTWSDTAPLVIPVSSSIVVFNLATNGVADMYIVLDE